MATFKYRLLAPNRPLTVEDYRVRARRSVPDMIWAFLDYGAEDMVTLNANRSAFDRYALRQRVLSGVMEPSLESEVGGEQISMPMLLAPAGLAGLVHWTGERGAAQAAEQSGSLLILSTASSYSYEEVAAATERNHFFQLYPYNDASGSARNSVTSSLIQRAKRAGYRSMFVTVDTPVAGNRESELKRGMGKPPVLTARRVFDGALHPRWAYGFVKHQRISMRNLVEEVGAKAAMAGLAKQESMLRPGYSWDDLAWMRDQWDGPFYIKGVLDAADAERAVDFGATGVVVSNHGGRQLDGAVAALDALPAIAERVGGRAEVLLDGGIRRGTDIIKALCLGADAVCIGRPYWYGLAVEGPLGAHRVIEILRTEMIRAMTLMGVRSTKELGPDCLLPADSAVGGVATGNMTVAGPASGLQQPNGFGEVRTHF